MRKASLFLAFLGTVLVSIILHSGSRALADSCCSGGECLKKDYNFECKNLPVCPIYEGEKTNYALLKEVEELIKELGEENVCLPPDFHSTPTKRK